MKELCLRFLIGGFVVSSFATLGLLLKPRTFSGLLGAAPSVALATLGLAVSREGRVYAATEARSMIAGAAAFFAYAILVTWLMSRQKWTVLAVTSCGLSLWFAAAFGLWYAFLR
jgi:hypothetical protein